MGANYTMKMSTICVFSMKNAVIHTNSLTSPQIPMRGWWVGEATLQICLNEGEQVKEKEMQEAWHVFSFLLASTQGSRGHSLNAQSCVVMERLEVFSCAVEYQHSLNRDRLLLSPLFWMKLLKQISRFLPHL